MDFEKELQELIQAALEAGVRPKAIAASLNAGLAVIADEAKEDDEDEDEDEDEEDSKF